MLTFQHTLSGCSNEGGRNGDKRFGWGNVNERNRLEEPGADGRVILKRILSRKDKSV